jgi:hypothetical protein
VHQNSLIADRPYRHEPHRRSTDRFTNCRRVSRIVLLPANVGLDIVGWHQPSVVPEFDQLAGPVVSRTAGLQAYDAGRQSSEERQYVLASQGGGDHDPPIRVHHVNLEDVFRQIEANRRNRPQSTCALPICGAPLMSVRRRRLDTPPRGAGVASAVHTIKRA